MGTAGNKWLKKCPASWARKESVDIDIVVTFRNGDRKIIKFIRIRSTPPSRTRNWNQLSNFR